MMHEVLVDNWTFCNNNIIKSMSFHLYYRLKDVTIICIHFRFKTTRLHCKLYFTIFAVIANKGVGLLTLLSRYQWPLGLRRRSRSLGRCDRGFESRLKNGFLSSSFCVALSSVGRGLCDGLITRPKESYRMSKIILRNPQRGRMFELGTTGNEIE
jgi:hypothetical protein